MTSNTATLEIPAKLAPIWKPKRYKVMRGGRGAGKSWSVAGVLLVMGTQKPLRILCAREVQKSIKDSVHRLLSDQITRLNLGGFYDVLETEIRGKNGTLFLFAGLQQHTVDSIKSFEGADIVWVEEAHTVSKKSWDVLIPTIRKPDSEIWMTLNPDMETDETYQRFIATIRDDAWVCEINWRDNPWFPEVLNHERKHAKRSMLEEDYLNIWEGKPKTTAQGAIYRHEMAQLYTDGRACRVPYDPRFSVHTVWDLGWNDAMSIAFVQATPYDIRVIDYLESSHRTLDWYVGEIEKRPWRWGNDYLPHDGKTANFQTGITTEQALKRLGRKRIKVLPSGSVEEGIRAVRLLLPRTVFDDTKAARLLECLKRYQRLVNSRTGESMGPLHDEYSHGADCFRYVAMATEHMLRNQQEPPRVINTWNKPLDAEIGY